MSLFQETSLDSKFGLADLVVEPHKHPAFFLSECLSHCTYLSLTCIVHQTGSFMTSEYTPLPSFLTSLSHSCLLHFSDTELCAVLWRVWAILLLALCTNNSLDQSDHPYTSPPNRLHPENSYSVFRTHLQHLLHLKGGWAVPLGLLILPYVYLCSPVL